MDRDSVETGAKFAGIEDYSRAKFADDDVSRLVREKLKYVNDTNVLMSIALIRL